MQSQQPKHLGLARRQSYNPLSTTKNGALALSLGALPAPLFSAEPPSGQRSVPAVDSTRRLGTVGRVPSNGEQPRTPGGSLVIGSEIFGFTGRASGRERWGDGLVDADNVNGGSEVVAPRTEEVVSRNWATPFENGIGASRQNGGFDLDTVGMIGSGRIGLNTESTFNLHTTASLNPYNTANLDSLDATQHSGSAQRAEALTRSERANNSLSDNSRDTVDSLGLGIPAPPASEVTQRASFPYGIASNSNSNHGPPSRAAPPVCSNYDQRNQRDELAFRMGNTSLNENNLSNSRLPPSKNGPYNSSYNYRSSNSSNQYQPYFSGQNRSSFQVNGGQDGYQDYSDPLTYFRAGAVNGSSISNDNRGREVSGQQSWGVASRGLNDYNQSMQQQASTSSLMSRQDSFSYSPAMSQHSLTPYGLAPGAAFGSPVESHLSFMSPSASLTSQQQIMMRGSRNPEYIAPGPPGSPNGYSQFGGPYGTNGNGVRYPEDMGRIIRSALLEEFRMNRQRSWELSDIAGHVVEFSADQLGSRHIQQKLEASSTGEKQMVFEEILPNLLQLSTDVFANYVIQKLFEQGTQSQKTAMAELLEGHVLQLSLQMYGCRVVQKALEFVLLEQQVKLIQELDGHILKCARDAQSNHVVQRALERIPADQLTFITDACIGEVQSLATHPYGCRVLQRIFENCPLSQTKLLLEDLHRFTQSLIQDQYGNYVIQWVIEKGEQVDRSIVIAKISGQLLSLAQQKFASNVIEKCVIHADEAERSILIEEVLTPAPDGSSVVKAMLVHPFANYVMQKILVTAVGAQREALFAQTTSQLANLRKFSAASSKHLASIEKLLLSESSS